METGLLEKRRGLGMFVTDGARNALTNDEQGRFIDEEVPAFAERIKVLGLDMNKVIDHLLNIGGKN